MKKIMMILTIAVLAGCTTNPTAAVNKKITALHQKAKAGKSMPLSEGKKLILAKLKDPASVRWGKSFPAKSGANDGGYVPTCIYVNAKNSLGGYVGNKISVFGYDENGRPFANVAVHPAVASVICGVE